MSKNPEFGEKWGMECKVDSIYFFVLITYLYKIFLFNYKVVITDYRLHSKHSTQKLKIEIADIYKA